MTIQHVTTGKQREVTAEAWERIKKGSLSSAWMAVSAPAKPKELKNVQAKQPLESDNNGVKATDNPDAGEVSGKIN